MTAPVSETRLVGPSVDRRILSLLDGYVALAGGSLALLEPDLYQLNVPKGDEARFDGRSVVRVAFTVDALELDDRAEMAIVGGSFVNDLIEAIRGRGSRLLAGWLVPGANKSDAAPGLPVPVRNGIASEAESSLARHRVGRLTARVAIRAGTELRERLADSALYDLCSGVALPGDVAAACQAPAPTEAVNEHWRSIASAPIQNVSSLVEKMLGDLETSLHSEIEEVGQRAARSLAEELQRIDRYYTAMLNDIGGRGGDIPDADSRRAIQAEHRRRSDEERDRHSVRAVVHPVQLTEWEMVTERAAWTLRTKAGHAASFAAQRSLAGAGGWVFGCPTCGAPSPGGLHVCRHDHVACDACSTACSVCRDDFCREHGVAACHIDGQPACDEHARTCAACRRTHCLVHEGTCVDGGHTACSECLGACAICGRVVCNAHASLSRADAPKGSRRFCHTCARTCEGGTGEIVGPDEVTDCASCERVVCERHQSRCAVDGKVHCSKHLRRTDRSRRLVCEADRATCSHEANAVFARDEVGPCATCGRVNCREHLVTCVVDGTGHCAMHLAAVGDKPGAFACDAHRSNCHIDGRPYTVSGTSPCPCCGRLACIQHKRECANCRRVVCTMDFSAAHPKRCATCVKLTPESDPPDEVIAAVVEVRRGDTASPKAWKMARDAHHLIVELDLGWMRRIVVAVPHGQTRAERTVSHSVLGSRILR